MFKRMSVCVCVFQKIFSNVSVYAVIAYVDPLNISGCFWCVQRPCVVDKVYCAEFHSMFRRYMSFSFRTMSTRTLVKSKKISSTHYIVSLHISETSCSGQCVWRRAHRDSQIWIFYCIYYHIWRRALRDLKFRNNGHYWSHERSKFTYLIFGGTATIFIGEKKPNDSA